MFRCKLPCDTGSWEPITGSGIMLSG
jgi:hypothetical protein